MSITMSTIKPDKTSVTRTWQQNTNLVPSERNHV